MLMQEATKDMIAEWKSVYNEYRSKLSPNKKTGIEIINYLNRKYQITEIIDEKWYGIVDDNMMLNEHFSKKLPIGKSPDIKVFCLENSGAGIPIYEKQDLVFKNLNIIIGIELNTSFFLVEGSSILWEEIFAFTGLDDYDLDDFYLVAEYISCLNKQIV